ncbi:CU044_2847 family protein [Azospirillum halopraeferens]|uniref:CU044_2847 family protein n=1 Tax=Azospirillum halopraeferens TaxID=34010 RepID=UPI0012EBBCC7|nr:CU044_2847 family protein [Azospirillum halopraeferens]
MSDVVLVRFPSDRGSVVVEIPEERVGPLPASAAHPNMRDAQQTFLDALAGLEPIVDAVVKRLEGFSASTATVEFGIKLSAKAGVVLASAETEGHLKLTLTWTRAPDA